MDVDEIFVEIDDKKEIDSDINNIIDKDEKPHHGKPITMIEVSPNGNYLVTYSPEDSSIIGWDVYCEDEGQPILKPKHRHIIHYYYNVNMHISVSNTKKIAYIYNRLSM
jgi:WD40 repeat protein